MPGGSRVTSCKAVPRQTSDGPVQFRGLGAEQVLHELGCSEALASTTLRVGCLPAQQRALPPLLHTQGRAGGGGQLPSGEDTNSLQTGRTGFAEFVLTVTCQIPHMHLALRCYFGD